MPQYKVFAETKEYYNDHLYRITTKVSDPSYFILQKLRGEKGNWRVVRPLSKEEVTIFFRKHKPNELYKLLS